MPTLELFAAGVPVTQGSAKIGRHGKHYVVLHDKHDELMAWRGKIARAARALKAETLDEPVAVLAQFTIPRPGRPKFEVPATRPDADKLLRAVCDGITDGGLLREDGRVFRLTGDERFEGANAYPCGVRIWVSWGDDAGPQWFDDARARLTV